MNFINPNDFKLGILSNVEIYPNGTLFMNIHLYPIIYHYIKKNQ